MDNLFRLIKKSIQDSDYTLQDVADHLGISKGVLINKLNPFCDSNRLSFQEFVGVTDFLGNMDAWRQASHEFGYLLVERETTPAACLNTLLVLLGAELGDLMRETHSAQVDGAIDFGELERIGIKAQRVIDTIESVKATAAQQANSNVTQLEKKS